MKLIWHARVASAIASLNGLIIFGFSASLVLIPQAYWWFGIATLVSFVLACTTTVLFRKYPSELNANDFKIVGALLLFGAIWWWSVLDGGSIPLITTEVARPIHLWPFIAACFLLAIRVFTPSPIWLWLGVCCGAFGAGLIAIYERAVLGLARADNGINAIPFGNLSLMMGSLSLIAAVYFIRQPKRSYLLVGFAVSAAFLGFLASLLSGTRGGWVAIPFIVALLLQATSDLVTAKVRNIGILVSILFLVAIVIYPPSGIWLRLEAIFDDIYQYFINDDADTSLGTRFELWRAGWYMFNENPLLGVGEGGVQRWLGTLASKEVFYERIDVYAQLHSDVIDTLARRGLLGIVSLMLLYIAFFTAFTKKMLTANDSLHTRLLAISGMMVIIAFFDFGLSQAMLRDLRGFSGFLGFSVAIWGCLGRQLQDPMHSRQISPKPLSASDPVVGKQSPQ